MTNAAHPADSNASEPKRLTIALTDRRPVTIRDDQWPVIAGGSYDDFDNQYAFQSSRTWDIRFRARRHQDGRAIVYATYDYDTKFQGEDCEEYRVGVLLTQDDEVATAIKVVAAQMVDRINDDNMHRHVRDAADECIADLPAEEI